MERVRKVVRRAYMAPFSVSSNFARCNAEFVALAASKGLISTRVQRERFSRSWRVTVPGLQWLGTSEVR